VLAEDVAGNRQDVSPVVGVRSPNVLFQSAE